MKIDNELIDLFKFLDIDYISKKDFMNDVNPKWETFKKGPK